MPTQICHPNNDGYRTAYILTSSVGTMKWISVVPQRITIVVMPLPTPQAISRSDSMGSCSPVSSTVDGRRRFRKPSADPNRRAAVHQCLPDVRRRFRKPSADPTRLAAVHRFFHTRQPPSVPPVSSKRTRFDGLRWLILRLNGPTMLTECSALNIVTGC